MDFSPNPEEELIRDTARSIAANYDDAYWIENQESDEFPEEFWDELAEAGFLGVNIPEKHGGEGMGMYEMSIIIEELAANGVMDAGMLFILTPIFGAVSVVAHGSNEQKDELLPGITDGDVRFCMALTEPDAGTNTTNIDTFAESTEDGFVVNGRKHWISGVETADQLLLIARTSPVSEVESSVDGVTMFVTDPSDPAIETRALDTGIPEPVTQFEVTFNDLHLTESDILGVQGKGFRQVFDTLNTERIAGAAGAVGVGRCAISRASDYATDRTVFDAPIATHQAIQHPLAEAYSKLEVASLMNRKAAWLYDRDEPCGTEANVAKLRASLASQEACDEAVQTHGGNGFSKENGVIQMWKGSRLNRVAPVTNQMIRNYLAEHVLDMPRSY
jgi:acyl-CoA dehydrogenase